MFEMNSDGYVKLSCLLGMEMRRAGQNWFKFCASGLNPKLEHSISAKSLYQEHIKTP